MTAALGVPDVCFQGIQGGKAAAFCKSVIGRYRLAALHGVQRDLELCRGAGQFRHPELCRIGEIEPEGLTGAVAVYGLLGGRHQLPGAQLDSDVFHPAVRDGNAGLKAFEVQRHPVAPGGRGVNGRKGRMVAGTVGHFQFHGLFGHRAHPAGISQAFVLPQLNQRGSVCSLFHGGNLLFDGTYIPWAASQFSAISENISGYLASSSVKALR